MAQVAPAPLNKSRGGKRTVTYRDATGKSTTAEVISAGTNSGLKLKARRSLTGTGIIDDVPACTSEHGTSCYLNRKLP